MIGPAFLECWWRPIPALLALAAIVWVKRRQSDSGGVRGRRRHEHDADIGTEFTDFD